MTTIAYRDGVVAADSQVTCYDISIGSVEKVARIGDKLALGVGTAEDFEIFRAWIVDGMPDESRPDLSEGNFDGALIDHTGLLVCDGKARLFRMEAPFCAWGSGFKVALGAMAMGADAKTAVEVACRFDVGSGPPIREYRL